MRSHYCHYSSQSVISSCLSLFSIFASMDFLIQMSLTINRRSLPFIGFRLALTYTFSSTSGYLFPVGLTYTFSPLTSASIPISSKTATFRSSPSILRAARTAWFSGLLWQRFRIARTAHWVMTKTVWRKFECMYLIVLTLLKLKPGKRLQAHKQRTVHLDFNLLRCR